MHNHIERPKNMTSFRKKTDGPIIPSKRLKSQKDIPSFTRYTKEEI